MHRVWWSGPRLLRAGSARGSGTAGPSPPPPWPRAPRPPPPPPALQWLRPFTSKPAPPAAAPTDPNKMTAPSHGDEQKPSKSQQLKKIFKEYGAVGVSFHIGISLMSLGIFYLVVSSGVDVPAILIKIGFKESFVQSKVAAGTSTFVVAYAIHKLLAPMRISITIVSVPLIVRYFRKVGFFKPPAPNP
ncbi:protein FAM210B, mitochondrial [Tachyglossus aculeatus]|uniref:protein FAM210B, mitochondrial n=1 Tax=Tachyglossus aculeatus TaxID=9261 RepID=UPI0018F546FD|nr:protein FAM210B, mitochondrial [Tachyglossus aculeatus]